MGNNSQIRVIRPSESKNLMTTTLNKVWVPGTEGVPKGFEIIIYKGDPETPGPLIMSFTMQANYRNDPHFHYVPECVIVLSGTVYVGEGPLFNKENSIEMTTGTFFEIPPKVIHYTWTKEPASIFILTEAPWKVVRDFQGMT